MKLLFRYFYLALVVASATAHAASYDVIIESGQGKLALHAESESKFFVKEVDAQFTFGRNSDGVVDSLTLHQNGQNQKGIRVSE
jgi:hypothetical protein